MYGACVGAPEGGTLGERAETLTGFLRALGRLPGLVMRVPVAALLLHSVRPWPATRRSVLLLSLFL